MTRTSEVFGSAMLLGLTLGSSAANAAPPAGTRLFLQCQACHSTGAAPHKIGPNLTGIMGARAATRPGYNYSPALKASGLVWSDATLDRWLLRPGAVVPGTKMVFGGMARPEDRRAVIAYLKTLSR